MEALERRIGLRRNATRASTQAPQWRGRLRPPQKLKSDPPIHNLLRPKNGLDNGVHCKKVIDLIEWVEMLVNKSDECVEDEAKRSAQRGEDKLWESV